MRVPRLPPWAVVVPAVLFGAALLGTALLASRSLGERDAAVREGILVRAGHELEARLRDTSPDTAGPVLERFLADQAGRIAGVAVVGPNGVVAQAGADAASGLEVTAALGREWRQAAMGSGGGMGWMGGRGGGMGRGMPSLRLRLLAAAALGAQTRLARLVAAGGVAGALALVGLALAAARGLSERQRREAAEAESERLEMVARAGAGLAHRLRNPLAVVKGTAQLLEGRVPPAERERVERIVAASGRMETILSRLLDFARPPEPQPTDVDLAEVAHDVAGRSGPGVVVRAAEPVRVRADREHVESVLEEFLANARSLDPGGELEVAVRREKGRAVAEVADRGPGLALDPRTAFEPYVTSRPDGTGLGLAIVKALATANGGTVSLAARPGGGCVASLHLPALEV